MHPVDVSYAPSEHALPGQVAQAVKRALQDDGDVLVFLPGAADIRRAIEASPWHSKRCSCRCTASCHPKSKIVR